MIEVQHLTKRYGAHTAVKDLSFTIEKGRVYGILGPNGAGKSTSMNILTGCLGASEGEVRIGGYDVMEDPSAAKKLVGYLPEQPPLYTDMTPEEYLRFVAKAKGIPAKEQSQQVRSAMERTKITDVSKRLIRNLSKGYRQRVGIAQALLGDPQVIILDEPTVGLDPAQIIEIRELIRELGRDHTMVLSSHILSEVQAVCDHIMIISRGELVASDTPENLTALFAGHSTYQLVAKGDAQAVTDLLTGMADVETFQVSGAEGEVSITLSPREEKDIREALFLAFAGAGIPLLEMTRSHASLEDVFLELTQDKPKAEEKKRRGLLRRSSKAKNAAPDSSHEEAPSAEETEEKEVEAP